MPPRALTKSNGERLFQINIQIYYVSLEWCDSPVWHSPAHPVVNSLVSGLCRWCLAHEGIQMLRLHTLLQSGLCDHQNTLCPSGSSILLLPNMLPVACTRTLNLEKCGTTCRMWKVTNWSHSWIPCVQEFSEPYCFITLLFQQQLKTIFIYTCAL